MPFLRWTPGAGPDEVELTFAKHGTSGIASGQPSRHEASSASARSRSALRRCGGRVRGTLATIRDRRDPATGMFYNWPGRCAQIRAFSGLRWKTHVVEVARRIAKKRNCSESTSGSFGPMYGVGSLRRLLTRWQVPKVPGAVIASFGHPQT